MVGVSMHSGLGWSVSAVSLGGTHSVSGHIRLRALESLREVLQSWENQSLWSSLCIDGENEE